MINEFNVVQCIDDFFERNPKIELVDWEYIYLGIVLEKLVKAGLAEYASEILNWLVRESLLNEAAVKVDTADIGNWLEKNGFEFKIREPTKKYTIKI